MWQLVIRASSKSSLLSNLLHKTQANEIVKQLATLQITLPKLLQAQVVPGDEAREKVHELANLQMVAALLPVQENRTKGQDTSNSNVNPPRHAPLVNVHG